jgi:fatty acid amide hydrolase 2
LQVTSEEAVKAYISRIQDVNPLVNAMMDDRFEAAILDARYVDRVVQAGAKTEQQMATETPFLGVPLSVKESIAVKGILSVCYPTAACHQLDFSR